MKVFQQYARYYDLLYEGKDYESEADYVHRLIQKYRKGARRLLNLGCGTGRHDVGLARRGYQVTGVDRSKGMLAAAGSRIRGVGRRRLRFVHGDIRTVRVGEDFDAVTLLFHVINYQVTNADLLAALRTAHSHLREGGVLLFDCVYGPAVLTERPSVSLKEKAGVRGRMVRIGQPVLLPNEGIFEMHYRLLVQDRRRRSMDEIREVHRIRYLFKTEIDLLFMATGFRTVHFSPWMKAGEVGANTWSVCVAATKSHG